MKSKISSKGQVTVPAEVRSRLGLQPGTVVVFEIRGRGALMRKGSSGRHPVDRVFGTLKLRKPTDVLLDEMRGPRPRRP
jgi:antitoxin PrlF